MADSKLHQQIADKESDKEAIAEQVIEKPELLSEVFAGLSAKTARIKYGSDKVLRIISEKSPGLLYPKIDFFISNLDNDNNFLKWGAIDVLANLTSVNQKNEFEDIFEKYFAPIPGPVLVTAANTIKAAARIVSAKPELADKIAVEILKVEHANYRTAECRNIALGQAIETFGQIFDHLRDREPVIKLVQKQLGNTRNATKKKAAAFLKKHAPGGNYAESLRVGAAQRSAVY
ncbi:MAG: hypothetical protein ACE5I1_00135 [bacterium]